MTAALLFVGLLSFGLGGLVALGWVWWANRTPPVHEVDFTEE